MNQSFNVINIALLTAGGILIYCGVKNISPKEALQQIIGGSKANTPVGTAGLSGTGFGSKGSGVGGKGKSGGGGGGGGGGSW